VPVADEITPDDIGDGGVIINYDDPPWRVRVVNHGYTVSRSAIARTANGVNPSLLRKVNDDSVSAAAMESTAGLRRENTDLRPAVRLAEEIA
jgi:hypothetical protein